MKYIFIFQDPNGKEYQKQVIDSLDDDVDSTDLWQIIRNELVIHNAILLKIIEK